MLFHRKKTNQVKKLDYDRESQKPVIRRSICNGEQVAGLKDLRTGHFEEIMLLKNDYDLEQFKEMTGSEDIPTEY